MRGIWILLSAAVFLQTCTSSPVGPPTIEYMDGPDATKVVFDENVSDMMKSEDMASNSTNTESSSTDSPASAAESEAEAMLESNDESEDTPTTMSPMDSENLVNDEETVTTVPEINTAADEPEADTASPTTSSSIDMS